MRIRDRGRIVRFVASVIQLVIVLSLLPGQSAIAAGPKTIYVYDTFDTAFDHGCKGWIWSKLGFMNLNGTPAADGTKVGDAISVGSEVRGHAISFEKGEKGPDGYKDNVGNEAWDLSRGALFLDVWKRLKPGDNLVICKHGGKYSDAKGEHLGGMIELGAPPEKMKPKPPQDSHYYAGFTKNGEDGGTHVPGQEPYPLPPLPAGKPITITIHSCYTANDPDGKGPVISVVASLQEVVGKAVKITGYAKKEKVKVIVGPSYADSVPAADKPALKQGMIDALAKQAKADNTQIEFEGDDIGGKWVLDHRPEDARDAAQEVIDADPTLKGKVGVNISWEQPEDPFEQAFADQPIAYSFRHPTWALSKWGGTGFSIPRHGLHKWLTIIVEDSLLSMFPGPPPGRLIGGPTSCWTLGRESGHDGGPLSNPRARLRRKGFVGFTLKAGYSTPVQVYQATPKGWRRVGHEQLNTSTGVVYAPIKRLGSYAAFSIP